MPVMRPIILSGGSGTRLWPVSRAKAPKQFVPLIGDENLFTATVRDGKDSARFAAPFIIGNDSHKFLIHDGLDAAGVKADAVYLEPIGRNTAAAALIAALAETNADIVHLIRPSDHIIADTAAWNAALQTALPAAQAGLIVTFGITPDYPETGYGYIQPKDNTAHVNVKRIAAFKEKPDAKTAATFISDGALWNSGIFLYHPKTLFAEAEKLAPQMLAQCRKALAAAKGDARGMTLDSDSYGQIAAEPFDRVFMERTDKGAVVPCAMGWNDVGSWQALWQTETHDADGNALSGPVVATDSRNNIIRSEGPTVAALGVENLAIVATKDAVLIAPRDRTQDVKSLLAAVEKTAPDLAQEHARARRPWGSYESIARGSHFQVKHITVLPGRSLSLQMHHHRAEHWIVVGGTAKTECDGVEKLVFPNVSIYIPKGAKHRLTNPGAVELHLIEVQSGDYLGEDDIVRFEDNYGRAPK